MLKKVPIIPAFFFSTKCPFLIITNTCSTFRRKSEGLGDFSLLNNKTTQILAGLLGILWLTSEAVDSCWATTTTSIRPAIARFSDLQSTTPFDEHYTCNIPVKLPDNSRIMLYAFADRLFRKLCWHIRHISIPHVD